MYITQYLLAIDELHKDRTFLVRQLPSTEKGVPLEMYVFSKETRWAYYEVIQSDIFDHLLALVGEFDLRLFQNPAGHDIRAMIKKAQH